MPNTDTFLILSVAQQYNTKVVTFNQLILNFVHYINLLFVCKNVKLMFEM